MIFILSGVAHSHHNKMQKIHTKKGKYDVPDKQQERLQIKDPTNQKINSILRTWDYRRGQITNKALKRMYADLETDETLSTDSDNSILTKTKKKKDSPLLQQTPQKKVQKIQTCLQETLQRKYLAAGRRQPRHPPAHPTAAPATAAAQAQPPNTDNRSKTQAKDSTTSTRNVILTRFKPGFEQQTEYELACCFCRPMRTYKEDMPYYPWLQPEPKVNFKLNFKG